MGQTLYDEWIRAKHTHSSAIGIDADGLSPHLFPHQRDLVAWALRRGRAAIFADTGLGKTAMQMEWARVVSARGALRPDALDLAIGSIDFQGLRDRPADLRFAVSRVVRQCINRGKA